MNSSSSIDRSGPIHLLDSKTAAETWVVIPVFNESSVIADVVAEVRSVFPNVVTVDDGSSDETWDVLRRNSPHPLRHLINRGQGAAIQTGTDYALARGAARIAHFDADGQHRLEDLVRMVKGVADGECDIALGNRFSGDASTVPAFRKLILRGGILFHRVVSGVRLNDVHNGLRVFSRRAAFKMEITADRMAHASELIDLIARSELPIKEFPVTIRYSEYSKAKGQRWTNGFRILFHYLVARIAG